VVTGQPVYNFTRTVLLLRAKKLCKEANQSGAGRHSLQAMRRSGSFGFRAPRPIASIPLLRGGRSEFLNSPRISRPITNFWKRGRPRALSRVRGIEGVWQSVGRRRTDGGAARPGSSRGRLPGVPRPGAGTRRTRRHRSSGLLTVDWPIRVAGDLVLRRIGAPGKRVRPAALSRVWSSPSDEEHLCNARPSVATLLLPNAVAQQVTGDD
jgi:hypothetical protein